MSTPRHARPRPGGVGDLKNPAEGLTFRVVDAFTSTPFSGNPAAVFVLPEAVPASWMRAVAAELNLPETAYLIRKDQGWALRWFTPTSEVDLCGHATLAAAHCLYADGEHGALPFHTRSGVLRVERDVEHLGALTLDLPAAPPAISEDLELVGAVLGRRPEWTGRSRVGDIVAVLANEQAVREATPDLVALAGIEARGLILTAEADGEDDVASRCFYPRVGIPEDPVTGSAHTALAPLWSQRLGRNPLRCVQVSRRGGSLLCRVEQNRVLLGGRAVTVWTGQLAAAAEPSGSPR